MRGLAACLWWTVAACGRIGFDPFAGDGGGDDSKSDGSAGPCLGPIETSFNGPLPAALTPYGVPPGMVQLVGGFLEVMIDGTFDMGAGVRAGPTSIIDRTVAVEIVDIIDSDTIGVTLLGIGDANGDLVVYSQSELLRVERIIPPSDFQFLAEVPIDLVAQRWWRIGATTTEILVDSSPDAADWTRLATVPMFLDPSQVIIEIGAGSYDMDIPADTARFGKVLDCM